ncbi:MAG: hypothetical protein JNM88_19595 [Chitinophagaceae bacterium]|nr:hypothetical protein [Chitinophagaceae bacterium]
MKKMILTLAIAVSTVGAFAREANVSEKVLNAFNTEFKAATNVEWTIATDYYMASFQYNEKYINAFYSTEGELLGLSRNLSPADLPLNLQTSLKKEYADYWISDLLEVAKSEGTSYYITLEDADSKIVLKASGGNGWTNYKKVKKA